MTCDLLSAKDMTRMARKINFFLSCFADRSLSNGDMRSSVAFHLRIIFGQCLARRKKNIITTTLEV